MLGQAGDEVCLALGVQGIKLESGFEVVDSLAEGFALYGQHSGFEKDFFVLGKAVDELVEQLANLGFVAQIFVEDQKFDPSELIVRSAFRGLRECFDRAFRTAWFGAIPIAICQFRHEGIGHKNIP